MCFLDFNFGVVNFLEIEDDGDDGFYYGLKKGLWMSMLSLGFSYRSGLGMGVVVGGVVGGVMVVGVMLGLVSCNGSGGNINN